MKKISVIILTVLLVMISGCTKVEQGNYKEGTYFGSIELESYGTKYVTTAVVYIGKTGRIESCFIDSTYNKDAVNTTKKTLGDEYGMKETSANIGVIEGGAEWYEQVEVIEKKVVSEQGINWVSWADDTKTKLDAVSGVTITANYYIDAIKMALDKAKK